MKAMIFAAGMGTRLFPLTEKIPKALVKIGGKPLLELVIESLIRQGFRDIVINVYHFSNQVIDFLKSKNNFGINICISDETDQLLDTGGGLKKASDFFQNDKSFLVHNVDVISNIDLQDLFNFHNRLRAKATLAVRNRETSRYLLFDEENYLCGWKNEQTGEKIISRDIKELWKHMAFSGIYVMSTEAFSYFKSEPRFSIIDVFLEMAKEKCIMAYQHDESLWVDVGKVENLDEAERIYRLVASSQ